MADAIAAGDIPIPSSAAAVTVEKAVEKATGVNLSKGTWGTLGTSIGGIVIAAGTWANSVKTDLQSAITKIDEASRRIERMEDRLDRLLLGRSGQRTDAEAHPTEGGG